MSIDISTAVWKSKCGSHTEKLVLLALADHANHRGECWPSMKTIAGLCGLTERAVLAQVNKLEKAGLIRRESKAGCSNHYTLTPERGSGVTPEYGSGHPRTRFTPEPDSPPNDVRDTPEHGSVEPPNDVRDTPEHGSVKPSRNRHRTVREPSKGKALDSVEVEDFAESRGMPRSDGATFFDSMEACGWTRGKAPLKDWRAHFRSYQGNGWLASQKQPNGNGKPMPALNSKTKWEIEAIARQEEAKKSDTRTPGEIEADRAAFCDFSQPYPLPRP